MNVALIKPQAMLNIRIFDRHLIDHDKITWRVETNVRKMRDLGERRARPGLSRIFIWSTCVETKAIERTAFGANKSRGKMGGTPQHFIFRVPRISVQLVFYGHTLVFWV